jgi:hypothetical protein
MRSLTRHLHAVTAPLPHYRIGGRVLVRRLEFDGWLARVGTIDDQRAERTFANQVRLAAADFRRR